MAFTSSERFGYTALPPGNYTRLVEIMIDGERLPPSVEIPNYFERDDVVATRLHVTNLDQPELYDALSYTWGNPLSVFRTKSDAERADKKYTSQVPILCDWKLLQVGASLYEALKALREAKRNSIQLGTTFQTMQGKLPPRPILRQFIWIDAVSIDQSNITERGNQVKMMDKIYRRADAVLIWLGPRDDFTPQAARTLQTLCSAPTNVRFQLSAELESDQYQALGIEPILSGDWLCLYAFLERHWFRRAWIIQEVALAKVAVAICGTLWIPWDGIVSSALWMIQTQASAAVWPCVRGQLENEFIDMMRRDILYCAKTIDKDLYQVLQGASTDKLSTQLPVFVIQSVWDAHRRLRPDDPTVAEEHIPQTASLLKLLSTFRSSRCTDPRDKVYSLLSLCSESEIPAAIPVDYSRTPVEVYTNAALTIMRAMGNLTVLAHCVGNTSSRLPGLPSWVPDWSTYPGFRPLDEESVVWTKEDTDAQSPFCADGGIGASKHGLWSNRSFEATKDGKLIVQGRFCGTIKATIRSELEEKFDGIFNVLSEIPQISIIHKQVPPASPADITESKLDVESASSPREDLSDQVSRVTLDPVWKGDQVGSSATEPPRNTGLSSNADSLTEPSRRTEASYQTRFEVLWRTLITDVWESSHPAPGDVGLIFAATLLDKRVLIQAQLDEYSQPLALGLGKISLGQLIQKGDRVASTLQALSDDEKTCVEVSKTNFLASRRAGGTIVQTLGLRRYLPDLPPTKSRPLTKEVMKDQTEISRWHQHSKRERMLFCTDDKKLGLGPRGAVSGDQVWILNGSRMPFILRPTNKGNYELVGEAYVHGIMHGEAVGLFCGELFTSTVDASDLTSIILE